MVKRCNHCQSGIELVVNGVASCIECGCTWNISGEHLSWGVKCAFPQPQNWSDDPLVKMQQHDAIRHKVGN